MLDAGAPARLESGIKAAVGWHALVRTRDTEPPYRGVRWIADPEQGVFAGSYEEGDKPNRALTLNTNGIVPEALLFARVGKPITASARDRATR